MPGRAGRGWPRWAALWPSPDPPAGRLALTALLGAGAIAADIGLIGTAAWLISKAAQHPNESQLAVAIVGVQFFGLSRGFFRYEERLVGHDAAFRLLADLRVRCYERLEQLAPSGLPAFRRGDLLARIVQDIDSLQDLVIRVIPPFGIRGAGRIAHRGPPVVDASGRRGHPGRGPPPRRHRRALAHRAPGPTEGIEIRAGPGRPGRLGGRPHRGRGGVGRLRGHGRAAGDDPRPGRRAHRHRRRIGGHRRGGLVPHHPAGRAGLLGLSPGRHTGGDGGQAERHRSGRGDPHPAGRLRAGGGSTRGHPGAPAGASGGGPAVRGDRRAGSRGRSAGPGPAARRSLRPGRPFGVGRIPERLVPGAPRGGPPARLGSTGGRGGAERRRQVDAGRGAPPVPALCRRFGPAERASLPTAWPATTFAPS